MKLWALVACGLLAAPVISAEPSEKERSRRLAAALKAEDLPAVRQIVAESVKALGAKAGEPEVPDEFRPLAKDVKPLTAEERTTAFEPYIPFIEWQKWWTVGLDPTKLNHAARELATIIGGCLDARHANERNAERYLKVAREAGDFLVWAQDQAGSGVIPFPAKRDGQGRPFEVAEQFYKAAEKQGKLDQVIRDGWAIDDFHDGGLQFDNGLAGVALLALGEATGGAAYRDAGLRAADWALSRPLVANWNYNSFSVFLLAEAYRVTNDKKYLDAAMKKALIGVIPGQLTEGDRAGRWADAHNARPAYHYIMIRALAALAAVMPAEHDDAKVVVDSLRRALRARNPDFRKGITNIDSALEALIRVKSLPARLQKDLTDCDTDLALDALSAHAVAGYRSRKGAIGPGGWGAYLAWHKRDNP
jgi:hypothetical protein